MKTSPQKRSSDFLKKHRGALFSCILLSFFIFLMVYALKKQPNFIPSQLYQKEAPMFETPAFHGEHLSLQQEISNYPVWTVLSFWTSACYICRKETTSLNAFYRTMVQQPNKKFNFISINIQDSKDIIRHWVEDLSIVYPIAMDLKGKISLDYGVTGTPEHFIIDPHKKVRFRFAGSFDFTKLDDFIHWLEANPHVSEEQALNQSLSLGVLH
ncbi:MAG: TlpA family protein disulfide reductase [Silvanigrellaceae bacterium]|nr:TlpA family protein disulfide reductase [Silvanigrellaceae bacterium]